MADKQFSSNTEKTPELSELTQNESLKQILNSKLVKFFSDDPASKIALVTAVITAGSFLVRVLDYIRWKGYLSVFSMDIGYTQFSSSQGFSEFLLQAIVFIGFTTTTSMLYIAIDHLVTMWSLSKWLDSLQKTKLWLKIWHWVKDLIRNIPIFLCVCVLNGFLNFLLWTFTASAEILRHSSWLEWVIALIVLGVIEFVAAVFMLLVYHLKHKKEKRNEEKDNARSQRDKLINEIGASIKIKRPLVLDIALSTAVVYIFILCTSLFFMGIMQANNMKRFPLIEDSYAVVYQNDEYYWTVAASEERDSLSLDTTRQKVIEIPGVEIEYREYKEVEIDYE